MVSRTECDGASGDLILMTALMEWSRDPQGRYYKTNKPQAGDDVVRPGALPSDYQSRAESPTYAGWKSHRASFNRARAVWSRRLIVPTGLANRSLISFSDWPSK